MVVSLFVWSVSKISPHTQGLTQTSVVIMTLNSGWQLQATCIPSKTSRCLRWYQDPRFSPEEQQSEPWSRSAGVDWPRHFFSVVFIFVFFIHVFFFNILKVFFCLNSNVFFLTLLRNSFFPASCSGSVRSRGLSDPHHHVRHPSCFYF